jgi:ribonuclease R
MLPEDLSNGICSLKPHEDRACMALHLYIDQDGNLTSHNVVRGLMNSAARLTYDQLQAAKDGQPDAVTAPLMDTVVNPLYEAFTILRAAREKRGALELEIPEYKAEVDSTGAVAKVKKTERPDSCKVIEEFMILANVGAPQELKSKGAPCVYRVHGAPPNEKAVDDLRDYISAFGLTLPASVTEPADFKEVLQKAAQLPNGSLVIKAIQRVQAKAKYDTHNIGHFGLALKEYAHFTSPIRRYSDLEVHRSLAEAFNLGQGGMDADHKTRLQEIAEHISETESLSAKAERSAHDRFAAEYLSKQIGKSFTGRISSVTGAGLFVKLDGAGAEGLILMRDLPQGDYYDINKEEHTLKGRSSGRVYATGDTITVRLKEADGLSGNILLKAANDNSAPTTGQSFKKKGPKPGPNGPRP